jgi:hypothetical protein
MASLAKLRTRWAAIGAACAVTLGGSTLGIVQASVSSGDRAVYVPITPVRVLDTRSDVGVATIQDATPALLTVTGSIATTTGQQNVVPVGASSVVINVTAINPTSDGFVSLRPGDATGAPAVSTLNVTVGGTFPNGATITLPTTGGSSGQIQIWYEAYAATGGTTDLLIDVVGYYTNHNHDDRYYTETEIDTALTNKPDFTSLLSPIVPSLPATIDSTGDFDGYTSITVGTNGNPIISYHDSTNDDLKIAACNNPTCTTSTNTTIDSTGTVGYYNSITIGTNGNPIISYYDEDYDEDNSALKVAACNNSTCTTSTNTTIDSTGIVGLYTSITIGTNGNPIISYFDQDNSALKVTACNNPTCEALGGAPAATNTTIDSNGDVGYFTSIAIGTNGNPIISYYDQTNNDLKIAVCNNPTCEALGGAPAATNTTIDSTGIVGLYTSITIGTNGNPIISYWDVTDFDLKVAACNNPTCTGATEGDRSTNATIDSNGSVGTDTSITIGTNGNPIISYYDETNNDLKIAVCNNPTCTGIAEGDRSTNTTIDSNGNVGYYTSIAIGTNGNPIISYFDVTNFDLKVFSPWWLTGGR